jgi:uncharacterized protein (DUF58 family)
VVTRRGWSLLGAAVGLYVGSRVLGLVALAALAAGALAAVALAVAWVHVHPVGLRGARQVRERLHVGVDGRVDLAVEATHRSPTTAVTESFDGGRRSARFLLAPLHPGEVARAAYRIPTERRGRFELGPLHASVSDPLGLAERRGRILRSEDVIIYPRVHEILALPDPGGDDVDRDQPRALGRLDPAGEFHTLRDYAPGDDLRRVHWRSTARRDRLMVRQHEARRRTPVLVVLDVRPGAHDRASFERAVEACASVANALERSQRPYEVVLSSGAVVGVPGRRHLESVMDELAIVQPHGPMRFAPTLARRRRLAVVAVLGRAAPGDSAALAVLVRGGGVLAVVATLRGTPAPATPRARHLPVLFDEHHLFPAAWNHAVLTWQRSLLRPGSSPSHARA